MKKMKAAVLFKPKDLRIVEKDIPPISPDEVLLRVKAVGVCGSDVHYYRDGRIGDTIVKEPQVLGHEFSGQVVEVGGEAGGIEVGMRVAVEPGVPCGKCEACITGKYNICPKVKFCGTPPVDGAYQEFYAAKAALVHPFSQEISFEEGAMIEPLAVALHSVNVAPVKNGDTVAVLGSGSIGLMLIQAARSAGGARIIATDLLDYRVKAAKDFGADFSINAGKEDPVAAIMEYTGGRGVDVAFEAAGVSETPQQAIEIVRPGGIVGLVGICRENTIPLDLHPARRKEVTLQAVRRFRHVYPRAVTLLERGQVNVAGLITHRLPLEKITSAFEMVENYADGVLKAVILP
jgi:L-iditol 2-dehydrogenase